MKKYNLILFIKILPIVLSASSNKSVERLRKPDHATANDYADATMEHIFDVDEIRKSNVNPILKEETSIIIPRSESIDHMEVDGKIYHQIADKDDEGERRLKNQNEKESNTNREYIEALSNEDFSRSKYSTRVDVKDQQLQRLKSDIVKIDDEMQLIKNNIKKMNDRKKIKSITSHDSTFNLNGNEINEETIKITNEQNPTSLGSKEPHEDDKPKHFVHPILLTIVLILYILAIFYTTQRRRFDDEEAESKTKSPKASDSLTVETTGSDGSIESDNSWSEDIWSFITLSIPLTLLEVDAILPNFMVASYIGRHLGDVHMDGFTLAFVFLNSIVMSLLWGFYSANETLGPQAFGAGNYKELGMIAMRSYIISLCILFFVSITLYFFMEDFLLSCGQEKEPSRLAQEWFRIQMIGLPFYSLYSVTLRFLSAQKIVKPMITVMIIVTCILLPLCLELLVPTIGFAGAAISLTIQQVVQAVLLLCYIAYYQPHHREAWPGISAWRESLDSRKLFQYIHLGIGGILAYGAWVWIKVITLLIGKLGVTELDAHGIATQFLSLACIFPLGSGSALCVYIGSTLPKNPDKARYLAFWFSSVLILLLTLMSVGFFVYRGDIFAIFTKDSKVLHDTDVIWMTVVFATFSNGVFAIFTDIGTGLGLQWYLVNVQTIFLWMIALPGIYIQLNHYDGDLRKMWEWIGPTYMVMNLVFAYCFITIDWNRISQKVCKREEVPTIKANE